MKQTIPDRDIKMIFLDLDGTLLNSQKELSPANYAALKQVAAKGISIVPCTGRHFTSIPEQIRSLPNLRYAITVNGADLLDVKEEKSLHSALIPLDKAEEVFSVLETLPVIFDCYQDNWGWMERSSYDMIEQYAASPVLGKMMRQMRTPVDNFRKTIRERNKPVQKIQMFFRDMDLHAKMLEELPQRFPDLIFTTSLGNNIEINNNGAHKGAALLVLCGQLGIDPEETMAFGDGINDISMLQNAGIGVAMGNACPAAKEVADFITDTNDNDGVAKAIAHFCCAE